MAYQATYSADDLALIVIDFIGGFFAGMILFVSLIVLLVLAVWATRKIKQVR